MLDNIKIIESNDILNTAQEMKGKGFRLAAITCEKEGEGLGLTYHYDKEYHLINVSSFIGYDDAVQSISHIYPSAFLAENEFQDLYGIHFENLTIDYKGRLYMADGIVKAPMLSKEVSPNA
jgi:ech hydrogenase subunit D